MVEAGKYYACLESDIARIWYITRVEEDPKYNWKDQYSNEYIIEGYLICVYIDGEVKMADKRLYNVDSAKDLEEMGEDYKDFALPMEDPDTKRQIFEMAFWSWE
jgi:hypothetical protein